MMERNESTSKNWEIMKLGEICEIRNGKDHKKVNTANGKYPIYGSGGIMGYANEYLCPEGTTIIGRKGSINKPLYVPCKFWNIDTAFGLVPRNNCEPRFLYYLCSSINFNKYNKSTTLPSLVKSELIKIPIPVPPLPVQARIVDELDCLQGILSKKRQQLAEYHSLAQAIFHQMFGDPVVNEKGWEVKKWKELFDTKLGKMLDRSQHTSSQKQYPYLANTNVQWGYFDLSDLRTMPFSDEELIKYDLEENDLLICEGGESGRCAIWHNKYSNQNILFQKAIHRARIKKANTVDITYISYFIRYSKELGGLKDYISKSTIEHLTGEKLKSLPIPLPPLPLQQSFAARIAAIDSQRERLAASIRELETLLACRMETLLNCPQA